MNHYLRRVMRFFKNTTVFCGPALLALFLLMATGCSKEEVAAPAAVHNALKKSAPAGTNGNGTVDPGTSGNGGNVSPITDDGDDLGDNERSRKPKS